MNEFLPDASVEIYCDHSLGSRARSKVALLSMWRRGGAWHAGKDADARGCRTRSARVSVLDGDDQVDSRWGPAIQFLIANGQSTGGLRERFELECHVCRARVEVRADSARFAQVLDACAAVGETALPLKALKLALSRTARP